MLTPKNSLIGQKFHKLTVLSFEYIKDKHQRNVLFWHCRCDCGNLKKIRNCSIRGRIKSCGCQVYEHLKEVHKKNIKQDIAKTYVIAGYKRSANDKNIEFSLSDEQFYTLTQQNCHYCGIKASRIKNKNGSQYFKGSVFIYNGVDRLNNQEGYSVKNCVACCTMCNIAKATHTKEKFLEWIERVYEFSVKAKVSV